MQALLVIALIVFGIGVWVIVKYGIKLRKRVAAYFAPFNRRKIREDNQVRNALAALVKAGFYTRHQNTTLITNDVASSEVALMVELNPKSINRLLEIGIESIPTRELVKRFIDANGSAEIITHLLKQNQFGHYLINKYGNSLTMIGY